MTRMEPHQKDHFHSGQPRPHGSEWNEQRTKAHLAKVPRSIHRIQMRVPWTQIVRSGWIQGSNSLFPRTQISILGKDISDQDIETIKTMRREQRQVSGRSHQTTPIGGYCTTGTKNTDWGGLNVQPPPENHARDARGRREIIQHQNWMRWYDSMSWARRWQIKWVWWLLMEHHR